jgi:hypothetical protein
MYEKFVEHCKNGLVKMEDLSKVNENPRNETGEKFRKPQKKSREPHGLHAYEKRPVIQFFPIGEAVKRWRRCAPAQEIFDMLPEKLEIFESETDRIRPQEFSTQKKFEVQHPKDFRYHAQIKDHSKTAMEVSDAVDTPEKPNKRSSRRCRTEGHGKSCQTYSYECKHYNDMD